METNYFNQQADMANILWLIQALDTMPAKQENMHLTFSCRAALDKAGWILKAAHPKHLVIVSNMNADAELNTDRYSLDIEMHPVHVGLFDEVVFI